MDLSIIIVNWNSKDYLAKCLESVYSSTKGLQYEVIVIDNASYDGSAEMVAKEFQTVKFIQSSENLGFARGNNRAALNALGRYILYLNPDTEIVQNALHAMCSLLEKEQDVGAVGCKLLNADGSIQYTCARAFPTPFNQFCELAGLNRLFPNIPMFSALEMHYWDHMDSSEVACLSGACMMVRKEIIDNINGFDESFFMYAEDVDLCYRISKSGWKIYYLADVAIFHHSGASSGKVITMQFFSTIQQRASNAYFLRKHFGAFKALRYRAAVLLGSMIRLAIIPLYALYAGVARLGNGGTGISYLRKKYSSLLLWSVGGLSLVSGRKIQASVNKASEIE